MFQNTQVTRGTATVVVTETGPATEMGQIADMVTATKRSRSPLQRELDGMTKVFGLIAWLAVAVIAIFGIARGQDTDTLVLLCISTAISAIPTGLPTFVQTMLSSGARRLAESKAVVKSLTDVETLGGTTVINSDKTGTLTMNAMTATTMLAGGEWFRIEGGGYQKTGAILGVAGGEAPDFRRLALGLILCTDATVGDDGSVIGDPTEAAFVVLAAKMGADARRRVRPCRAGPRCRSTPSTSSWPPSTTAPTGSAAGSSAAPLHDASRVRPTWSSSAVAGRCGTASRCRSRSVRDEILAVNHQLSERGLRVLAFAVRDLDDAAMSAAEADPMAAVTDLILVALVGIIDPLRTEAKDAVRVALDAGIDVRMITGDHTVTARAIADELGLGSGVITGTELQQLPDPEVIDRLPELHVFGRVAPEDKLRLARLMQESGDVVAMTGDAVNDAAALKQADIGVAMGSGSEVSKQAAKIVLTDDNFATLVRAVDLGRDIYRRITSYVKLQLTILSSVLQLMVFATIFNINDGVALFPMQLLFCKFFVVVTVVIGFIVDVPDPGVMQRPPRKPGTKIVNTPQIIRWVVSGFVVAAIALAVLEWGPDEPSTTAAVGLDDDGLRHRRAQRGQPRPGHAARARGAVVIAGLPLPRLDHPGLGPHLGRRRAPDAPAPARHHVAHRTAVGGRPRPVAPRADGRRGGQGDPAEAPAQGQRHARASPERALDDTEVTAWPRRSTSSEQPEASVSPSAASRGAGADPPPKLKRKAYERELRRLHGELVAMQEWVKASGAKICVVFEGRDTAGKGGTIKPITERVSPRVFRVVALSAPTEREQSQMYVQRYLPHLPAAGEVVIFDRSWYNRAGVERVMGFCTPEETERFLELAPAVEKAMVDSGILLLKYWLEVSPDEQTRRLERRIDDPRKVWKLVGHGPEVLQPLVRLLPGPGRHVRRHRHRLGALVRRGHRRQAARPAQHHQPPAEPGPLQATRPEGRHAAQAAAGPAAMWSQTSRCGTSPRRSESWPSRWSGPGAGSSGAMAEAARSRSSWSTGWPMTTGRSPRASSIAARPRRRRRCARSRRRRGWTAAWAVRSGPAPTVIPSNDPRPSATGR